MDLHLNSEHWQFVEGPGTEDGQGVIQPRRNRGAEDLAVYAGSTCPAGHRASVI